MSENTTENFNFEKPTSKEDVEKFVKESPPERVVDYIIKLNQESTIDHLTGVLTRGGFDKLAPVYISALSRRKEDAYLMFIDLDKFKEVNDTQGHRRGDELLKRVARQLEETFRRKEDIVARYGGDEFVVLFSPGDEYRNEESAIEPTLQNLMERTSDISISVGVAKVSSIKDLEQALDNADKRMYVDKKRFKEKDEEK